MPLQVVNGLPKTKTNNSVDIGLRLLYLNHEIVFFNLIFNSMKLKALKFTAQLTTIVILV